MSGQSRNRKPSSCWSFQKIRSDRKSTRLNSSHQIISYAVFCLKKKKKKQNSSLKINNDRAICKKKQRRSKIEYSSFLTNTYDTELYVFREAYIRTNSTCFRIA